MKNLFLILNCLLLSLIINAQNNQGINYQAAVTDSLGNELVNQNVTVRLSIISDSIGGNIVWQEDQSVITDQFGLFNLVIGQGNSTQLGSAPTFSAINWSSFSHFLKVEFDAYGGTNFSLIGTTQMMSVPYALYAEKSGTTVNNIRVSDFGDSLFVNGQFIYIDGISFHNSTVTYDTLTDQAGNIYLTMQIGTQEWMCENLRTDKYLNGDAIPMAQNGYSNNNVYDAWVWPEANQSNEAQYGKMYNQLVVDDSRGVCPSGWRVPTLSEWQVLILIYGYYDPYNWPNYYGGDALKAPGSFNGSPSTGTGESYVNLVPGVKWVLGIGTLIMVWGQEMFTP